MSRGVVLWPDAETELAVRRLWALVEDLGCPSLASRTHRRHRPHLSLTVAEHLPVEAALAAVGPVPSAPIELRIESVAAFPGHHLVLVPVPNLDLLHEQLRVHAAVRPLATDPWPYLDPGRWMPHITLGSGLDGAQLGRAAAAVVDALPLSGWLDPGGVEDGTTGDSWPAPR